MAVNCWVVFNLSETGFGLTVMLVNVWLTVTFTLLVTVRPLASVIVAVKV